MITFRRESSLLRAGGALGASSVVRETLLPLTIAVLEVGADFPLLLALPDAPLFWGFDPLPELAMLSPPENYFTQTKRGWST